MNLLSDIAEKYSEQFKVDSLEAYDALEGIWKHAANQSEYVIPAAEVGEVCLCCFIVCVVCACKECFVV